MVARAGNFGAHSILSGLPSEFSSRLLARAPTISLEKGQTLFEIGAIGDGCYWLEEGVLKAQSGFSLFSDLDRSSVNSQCLTACQGPPRFKRSETAN